MALLRARRPLTLDRSLVQVRPVVPPALAVLTIRPRPACRRAPPTPGQCAGGDRAQHFLGLPALRLRRRPARALVRGRGSPQRLSACFPSPRPATAETAASPTSSTCPVSSPPIQRCPRPGRSVALAPRADRRPGCRDACSASSTCPSTCETRPTPTSSAACPSRSCSWTPRRSAAGCWCTGAARRAPRDLGTMPLTLDVTPRPRGSRPPRSAPRSAGGRSRSPSVIVAYLMVVCGMRFDDAVALVKRKRDVVAINPGACRPGAGWRARPVTPLPPRDPTQALSTSCACSRRSR